MAKPNALITREYLDERLDLVKQEILEAVKEDNAQLLAAIKEDNAQLKDDVLGRLDKKEEDEEVHDFSHQRINDELSDHEARLKSIEAVSKS